MYFVIIYYQKLKLAAGKYDLTTFCVDLLTAIVKVIINGKTLSKLKQKYSCFKINTRKSKSRFMYPP